MPSVLSRALHIAAHCLLYATFLIVISNITLIMPSYAQDADGLRPLFTHALLTSILPEDVRFLDDADTIERFLESLDGKPPNWKTVYGDHGQSHDESLFALNRERDALREGHEGLTTRLTFIWSGELSAYDSESGGYRVAIGPKLIPTRWGVVRFKPNNLPSNLVAVPSPALADSLRIRISRGERIEIDVAITGRLLPEESIIYDFAHDEPGQGMVMPVVRVERVDYLLRD